MCRNLHLCFCAQCRFANLQKLHLKKYLRCRFAHFVHDTFLHVLHICQICARHIFAHLQNCRNVFEKLREHENLFAQR